MKRKRKSQNITLVFLPVNKLVVGCVVTAEFTFIVSVMDEFVCLISSVVSVVLLSSTRK